MTRASDEGRTRRTTAWLTMMVALACFAGCSTRTTTEVSTIGPNQAAPWKSVRFGAVRFAVPPTWPVHDLAIDPKQCVRFDVDAVYLGRQGLAASCPARLLGRADAVQIQLLDPSVPGQLDPTAGTVIAGGQTRQEQPNSMTTRSIVTAFPKLGVLVTASFRQDPAVARRIVDSVSPA